MLKEKIKTESQSRLVGRAIDMQGTVGRGVWCCGVLYDVLRV